MSTLSVPLTAELESFIADMVRSGVASNKADVVRRALTRMAEEEAINDVFRSQQEIREGRGVEGNIREILAKMP
jgi:Arc/MetJ-type ribon-helix-helix transcriptional regulator